MEILKKFNIIPKDKKIYEYAFMHSSYANEHKIDNNYERLEFLGDAVLDLVISEFLYSRTEYEEGKMTKLRAGYVCENALYQYSKELDFSKYIKVGHGEELSGGKYKKAILADIFEAFVGALYIDQGYNVAHNFINKVVIPHIKNNDDDFLKDYKSILQELVQTDQKSVDYEVVKEKGPSHNKEFTIAAKVDNITYGIGKAHSKKAAEQMAAKDAMNKLATK